ncbi:MAG TPA: type II secretion system protein [Bryobacteraceae bacterium]|nr:type II secretion system protein [Bryobacteraceae bacterium]
MRNIGHRRGVTLIELLVAMALLSLLAVGVLFGMRIGLGAMERTNNRLQTNRKVLGVERVLTQQIAGLVPVRADCFANPQGPPTRGPFFQGEGQTMRFVSTFSLNEASRGYARILEYQVIPGQNAEGVRLVVNELLFTGPRSAGALCIGAVGTPTGLQLLYRPVQVGEHSFVLADKLASCRFLYKENREPPRPDMWLPRWASARLPNAIRIDLAPLSTDPSLLEVPSVVAPVRVNRDPMMDYQDYVP